jgi:Interferon-induced transmembrane protein
MWQSLVCLLTLLPSALVAVVYSSQVNRRAQVGDMTGAVRASRLARAWCLVTVITFTVLILWLVAAGVIP